MFQQRNNGWTRRIVVSVTVFAMAASTCAVGASATVGAVPEQALADVAVPRGGEPNIVLILTDDQRCGHAVGDAHRPVAARRARHRVHERLRLERAVLPEPGDASSPVSTRTRRACTRTTGQPFGGFPAFDDGSTVATWLHDAGYRTALLGKYLNGYAGTVRPAGLGPMVRDLRRRRLLRLLREPNGGVESLRLRRPGLQHERPGGAGHRLHHAPPATTSRCSCTSRRTPRTSRRRPAQRDADAFSDLQPGGPPSYNEADVVRQAGVHPGRRAAVGRRSPRPSTGSARTSTGRCSRWIAPWRRSSTRSTVTGRLSNTMIVFMSDNGMLWGEHRWHNEAGAVRGERSGSRWSFATTR